MEDKKDCEEPKKNIRPKKEKSELDLQIDRFCRYIRKHPEIFQKENLSKLIDDCHKKEEKKEDPPIEPIKEEEPKKEIIAEIKQKIHNKKKKSK